MAGRGFIPCFIILSKEDINLHTISVIYLDDRGREHAVHRTRRIQVTRESGRGKKNSVKVR